MNTLNNSLTALYIRLKYNDEGATAVEYGMMVALIAAVIVAVVATLGTQVNTAFTSVSDQITTAQTP